MHPDTTRPGASRIVAALLAGVAAVTTAVLVLTHTTATPDGSSTPVVDADTPPQVPTKTVEQPEVASKTTLARGVPSERTGGHLVIDSVGIDTVVDETTEVTGFDGPEVVIPDDVSRVAWLNTAAHPGDLIGSSLITGHVSDVIDRPGALWRLREVNVGDQVVWHDGGKKWTFVITGKATYPRSGALPPELFDTTGPRALYIVTCDNRQSFPGGGFTYRDNLVVKAELYGVTERGFS